MGAISRKAWPGWSRFTALRMGTSGGLPAAKSGRTSSSSGGSEVIATSMRFGRANCLDSGQSPQRKSPVMPERTDSLQALRRTALIGTLRQSRMFADLSSENLMAVADVCSLKALEKGEMLFHEGDKAEGFYVLQTGAISVFKITPDGREQ